MYQLSEILLSLFFEFLTRLMKLNECTELIKNFS